MIKREMYMKRIRPFILDNIAKWYILPLNLREEFQNMPCYPAEGSIAVINGIITVKFSE
ncbi:MAG: hypothetical protein LUI01_00165 [Firmicutes bacterium]|nr:hypothetical protein [Bacillota bacterium]